MRKILCFLILPAAFILTRIPVVKETSQIVSCGLFITVDFTVSLLFYFVLRKIKFTLPTAVMSSVMLSAADRLIKIIIYRFDFGTKLIGHFLRIEPTKNLNQTAMFNFLNIELDGTFVIIFKAVLVLLVCFVFIKLKNKSTYAWYAFVLLLSASLATLADSAAWGYTLDYVLFSGLTCYDLKDFYVDAGIGFIIMEVLSRSKKREAE